jgi:hypothetical protein
LDKFYQITTKNATGTLHTLYNHLNTPLGTNFTLTTLAGVLMAGHATGGDYFPVKNKTRVQSRTLPR